VADFTVKRVDDMEAVYAGAFIRARASLGASAFGMQVIEMPAGTDQYPQHDHGEDGQEEIYIALRGSGEIEIEGERHPLDSETFIRVGPGTERKVWTEKEPLRLLILGGVPGEAYEPPDVTKLGAPDPLAAQAN
jgi:mannose-6-phosphate isomerase-like protein (cupin superfamily)